MTTGPAQLDPAALDTLREIGGDEFLGELVDSFLAEAPSLLGEIRDAMESGNAENARRAAHTLKSNAATFGANALSELCRELEELARTGDVAGADELLGQVGVEYARVEAALAALREGAPS